MDEERTRAGLVGRGAFAQRAMGSHGRFRAEEEHDQPPKFPVS
jgi:hypothetical protein